MVTTSGFSGSLISRTLILTVISTSLLASILDIKHLLPIKPTPHLWPYLQFSRIFTFQLAYISSTELLFAVVLLYQCRVLERLWGSRRFGSFVLVTWMLTGPLVVGLGIVLKALSAGWWAYIPPGVTGLIVALVAVWREEVPRVYGFKIVSGLGASATTRAQGRGDASDDADGQTQESTARSHEDSEPGMVFGDKFVTYAMAAQLALSQFPYQLLPALVGWVIGSAWREELLPMSMMRWRIPAWVVGESSTVKGRGQYEGLRRRLEEEGSGRDGMREVSDRVAESQQSQRRGIGQRMMGYFTGS